MPSKMMFFSSGDSLAPGRIMIYGAGGASKSVSESLSRRKDISVLGYIDSFKEGSFLGKKITPSGSLTREMLSECDTIVVASAFYPEIIQNMQKYGDLNYAIYDEKFESRPDKDLRQESLAIRSRMDRFFQLQPQPQLCERVFEYAFIFKGLARKCPKTVLDVGPGTTPVPQLFRVCGFDVTAIDVNALSNVHFDVRYGNVATVKFEHTFDAITCVSTLEHVENQEGAISNMHSMLSDGGVLLLTFPFNETIYIDNISSVEGVSEKVLTNDRTTVFSREMVKSWVDAFDWSILDEELYTMFTGEHFGMGEMLDIPRLADSPAEADLMCLALGR